MRVVVLLRERGVEVGLVFVGVPMAELAPQSVREVASVGSEDHERHMCQEPGERSTVFDPKGGAFMNGKYVPSLLAAIGDVVAEHMTAIGYGDFRPKSVVDQERPVTQPAALAAPYGAPAPKHSCRDCGSYNLKKEAGCEVCGDCGSSKCG